MKPVDNGINVMAPAPSEDGTLWTHIAPDPQANEVHIAVSGMYNGRFIERRFTFTEHEIVEAGRTAMELVWERLAEAYL